MQVLWAIDFLEILELEERHQRKYSLLISEKLALKSFDRSSSGVQSSQKLSWKVPTNSNVLFVNGETNLIGDSPRIVRGIFNLWGVSYPLLFN
ncbi:hypothetical protein CDAR_609571 [Caerostris darwini]|uniref:Uncharacterized protein n=1 Tax=Caerostris darwini TaxID=1538125 RepID=A0AAV4SCQ2_9ARAC|nr:hypothetical protein CDAR_609571 [Caerostris darwini]